MGHSQKRRQMGRRTDVTLLLSLGLLVCGWAAAAASAQSTTREDGRCGPGFPAADGFDAECEDIAPYTTCCQVNQHCGWECDHVQAGDAAQTGVTPPSATTAKPSFTSNGKYRSDGRCGPEFPWNESTGEAAECDPNSEYWCCSEKGWCGGTQEHCYCDACVNYRPVELTGRVRSDRRCGPAFPLSDGTPSECDGASANHCCSKHGYCGPGDAHCACVGCVDYRGGAAKEVPVLSGRVRNDRRCGREFPLADGTPSECDGQGPNHCCSRWGYCGPGADHCDCPQCKDYRPTEKKVSDDFHPGGLVRRDRRCGKEFPLPGGTHQLPSLCDPTSSNYCCSKWGYCGGDADHCDCPECVNYRALAAQLANEN